MHTFNPACFAGSIYKNLKYFETIHANDLKHTIVKRGLQESYHPFNKIKQVEFKTLGRSFRLILSPKRTVLHSKFKAYAVDADGKETTVHLDRENFYGGRVFGESESDASVHIDDDNDGVLTGTIHLPDETYHIEPSWRHLPHLDNRSMIAYRASDVQFSWEQQQNEMGGENVKTCGYVKEGMELEEDDEEGQWGRDKRQIDQYEYTPTKTRCPLLLVADYRFFQEMGGSNTKTTINYLVKTKTKQKQKKVVV